MELNNNEVAPRVVLSLPILFRKTYGRRDENGLLKNISLTGALLESTNQNYAPNDKLIFQMHVSGRERNINAKIVWQGANGYGVQFLPFNKADVQLIDDLIYFVNVKKEGKKDLLSSIFKKVS